MARGTERSAMGAYARSLLAAAVAGGATAVVDVDGFSSFVWTVAVFVIALAAFALVPRLLPER